MRFGALFIFFGLVCSQVAVSADLKVLNSNPFMNSTGAASMHADTYNSDVHPEPGPIGNRGEITYFKFAKFMGLCPTFITEQGGNLVTVCLSGTKTKLYLMERGSLKILAEMSLPPRPDFMAALASFQIQKLFKDTSGGAYFYLDHENRVVIPTAKREILVIRIKKENSKFQLVRDEVFDLNSVVTSVNCPTIKKPVFGDPGCDKVTAVLPDFQGNYWFTSRFGVVGVISRATGEIRSMRLPKEQIQNSFAMTKKGAYIVSDQALYFFATKADGAPEIVWRESYDRGTRVKPGQINQGSGTTPTVQIDRTTGESYVSILDNADPYIQLRVFKTDPENRGSRQVCTVPLFGAYQGAVENSVIGYDRMMIVANTYGYYNALKQNDSVGGMTRVDIRADGSGCDVVWNNDLNAVTATPKYSMANGLVYFYSEDRAPHALKNEWSLRTLDPETGRAVSSIYTGRGRSYDNAWGTISFGTDGAAYIGSFKGMIRVRAN